MRVSTNAMFQTNTSRLMDLQSQLSALGNQIATGKRVNTPADDPVAAARILELNQARQANATYTDTRKVATTTLETYEVNLASATNVIQDAQSLLISAGNGGYSDLQRATIASELQGKLDTLMGLANTKNAQGNYLYAGYQSDTVPFDSSGQFQGDSNRMKVQIEAASQMSITFTGDQVFQANGNDTFATLNNIITLLKTPITDAATQASFNSGLKTAIDQMQGVLDNVLNTRAEVGSKLNQIEALDNAGADLELQYASSLSNLQDLDYTQALSELSKKNTILEAAQKSFVATSQISLFKLI